MNSIKKYAGLVLVLIGVICFIVYKAAVPENALLVTGIALEIVGILSFIFINKKLG